MPDRAGSREAASKLFNVYMRPWVLYQDGATTAVPHIRDLDRRCATVAAVQPPRKRLRGKQLNPDDDERSHACAWSQYVRGHIVSRHAHRLIVQFMAACCKATRGREDIIDDPEKEQKRREAPAAAKLPLVRLHAILDNMSKETKQKGKGKDGPKDTNDDDTGLPEPGHGDSVRSAVQLTAQLWDRNADVWPARVDRQSGLQHAGAPNNVAVTQSKKRMQKLSQAKAYHCMRKVDGEK